MKKALALITSVISIFSLTSCSDKTHVKQDTKVTQMRHEDKLFQTGKINELNIKIGETEWKELLENASEKSILPVILR